ncbi:MAG: SIR2 family protein [Chitinivibrionales bacterium]|nr:SIR2 family protein [Chitinivibrionales bacterium]
MTTEAISESVFIREFTRELHNKNAAVFAGAGLSSGAGYVDWKILLKDIINDLGLDADVEHDLVTLAQYHCNQAGGNKSRLAQTIFDHFSQIRTPTESHRILARLPIQTYWTTNYDKLIEKALTDAKKIPDIKYTLKQLSITKPDRNVIVYKMHGDIEHPSEAVICKDDYEKYPIEMNAFVSALRGDLIERTFLFLGFSFTDPNIDYILSRVRVQYDKDQRHHYCIQKRVSKESGETKEQFKYELLKQDYFIRDLKRFAIQTVLVDSYSDIPKLLRQLANQYKSKSVFISGAAHTYGHLTNNDATTFIHNLSYKIKAGKNRIVTGFGLGVGGAVINGALSFLNDNDKTLSDEDIVIRPFPQVATGDISLKEEWAKYRVAMIDFAGIAIFLFGNKVDSSGNVVLSAGMKEEFDLCIKAGVVPLPVGATGYMAKELWDAVWNDFPKYFPGADSAFRRLFEKLGDTTSCPDEIMKNLETLIAKINKG